MSWGDIWGYALSGAIVSWPVFIAGQVISHRKLRQHVDNKLAQQTGQLVNVTDQQTETLLHSYRRWWHRLFGV